MDEKFYNGNRLLTMKDKNGEMPEIFIVSGNRTAGKTYFFKKLLVDRFKKKNEKFCLLVRFNYEMDSIEETFFKDLIEVHYPEMNIKGEWVGRQLFKKIFIDDKHAGYCVAINSADTIKKYSSGFVDVSSMFFDEFQSENGKYVPDEINKFISIHVSMARGGGKQTRYLPVYMASNTVSILNPYYSLFGISKMLRPDTKFLKGDGWVLEMTYNKNAAESLKQSGFGRATSKSQYITYASQNKYLLDNDNFVKKISEHKQLYCNLVYAGKNYGVWLVNDGEYIYLSKKYDPRYPINISFRPEDHNISYIMQKRSAPYTKALREMYEQGRMFFEDLECKDAFFDFIGYTVI